MIAKTRRLSHYALKSSHNVTCKSDDKLVNRLDGQMDMLTKKIHAETRLFTHAQIHNGRIDFNQILHIHSLGGLSDIFESPSKLVQGFW